MQKTSCLNNTEILMSNQANSHAIEYPVNDNPCHMFINQQRLLKKEVNIDKIVFTIKLQNR